MPRSAKRLGDVGDERARVLEVVEHRDARDRLGLLVGTALAQGLGRIEVVDDVVPLGDRVSRDVGGIEAQVAQALRLVAIEQRAVVAADVDDKVAGLERHDRFDPASYAVEVVGHRAVDAAAIPVGAVEDRAGDGVLGLDQAARLLVARHVAAHQLERDRPLDRLSAPGSANAPAMRWSPSDSTGARCAQPQIRHVVRVIRLVRGAGLRVVT